MEIRFPRITIEINQAAWLKQFHNFLELISLNQRIEFFKKETGNNLLWRRGVVVIPTTQLHSRTQVLRRFTSCSRRDGDSRGPLTMALAGNKAKHLLPVNHITKSIHHHHSLKLFDEDPPPSPPPPNPLILPKNLFHI